MVVEYVFWELNLLKFIGFYLNIKDYCKYENINNNRTYYIENSQKKIIVPNYFEPFENKNNELLFAYKNIKNLKSKFIICKGDGDQDRPNLF